MSQPRKRVLLLVTPSSYRSGAFAAAAERLGIEAVQGVDVPPTLAAEWNVPLGLDFADPEGAARAIERYAGAQPVDAIISVDDSATVLASLASRRLGLPHNDPEAALAARDKLPMRRLLAAGGVPVPEFAAYPATSDPQALAADLSYPVVVKPTQLSGSRGVIRADTAEEFVRAFARTRQVIEYAGQPAEGAEILVEEFLPGFEVALEGLLDAGQLRVLALFDKPDPLDGPLFEETIYVTPSRLSETTQRAIADCTAAAATALGLRTGPVHAELRVNERGPWLIEIAGRSIGGLCSTILEFGTGFKLEDLILKQAVGESLGEVSREGGAVGVMMIPIPRGGLLKRVEGLEEAEAVPGVTGIEITARLNHPIVPLPEGASYLGFIFAQGDSIDAVEDALRQSHERLSFVIVPEIRLAVTREAARARP
ncbi:MAG TPA: ATP-grasp domain-containing protein [Thermomicrobiaceae bacterium]|nr:ATP-grasp domain-containing protein [Thermomicrobiaceae bacterium]